MRYILSIILLFRLTIAFSVNPDFVDIHPCNDYVRCISYDFDKNIQQQFCYDYVTYIISNKIDLAGQTLHLPVSTIRFENEGCFLNGTIEGNNSVIEADDHIIFGRHITIKGTWNNHKVYSTWFSYEENEICNEQWNNIVCLCEGKKTTHLYSPDTTYLVSGIDQSAPIKLPSNVYWHNQSTIQMKGCSLKKYSIVLARNVENITIDGGTFLGDIRTHIGDEGQWGHGIKIGGGRNIYLKNLSCNYCWGDGIDLIEGFDSEGEPIINCSHVTIDNVRCLYNRRQGMSIEAADHVKITNCEFAYTGTVKRTNPSAGIDIEPWINNTKKIFDINIKNCNIHDNKGHDFLCMANWLMREKYYTFNNAIVIEDCEIGRTWVTRTVGISFLRCKLKEKADFYKVDNVKFEQTLIEDSEKNSVENFPNRKCKLLHADLFLIVLFAVWSPSLCLLTLLLKKLKDENNRDHHNS